MQKIIIDLMILAGVIFAYIFLAAFQPGTNSILSSSISSTNWTGFESTEAAISGYAIYVWFLPGLIGIIAFVLNHKMK